MSVTLSWDDFWPFFNNQSPQTKIDLIKQIEIAPLLNGISAQHQTEILKTAPPELIKEVEKLLYLQTRINLGLEQKPKRSNKRIMRLIG